MHIPRFYIEAGVRASPEYLLPEAAAHHAIRVLRLAPGAPLLLFDGEGRESASEILRIEGPRCWVRVALPSEPAVESPLHIHLGQAVLPSDKFDWVLQKAVELGVMEITPLLLTRAIVRLGEGRADKKLNHWRGVVQSATEQSGRVRLTKVHPPSRLSDWVAGLPEDMSRVLLDPRAAKSGIAAQETRLALIVGPEGGFDPSEEAFLKAAHFRAVRLGPRTLRAETAALAAVTAFQVWSGDFR